MKSKYSFMPMRTALIAAAGLALAGCTQGASPSGAGLADTSNSVTQSETIAQTLQTTPEFSHFRDVIKQAGLWESLSSTKGLTILAPTNAAFDQSDPNWRANTQAQYSIQGDDASRVKRQALIQTSEISGVHPPSDFAGKLQDVRTIGGEMVHVDGRTPGVIKITTGPAPVSQFGKFPSRASATMQTPPLIATNGLIYSLDAITVSDVN